MKLLAPAAYKFNPADWPEIHRLLEEGNKLGVNDQKRLGEIYKKNIHVSQTGELLSSSASSITSYDSRQPFGCNRKLWFGDVAGILTPEDPDGPTALGTIMHGQIEHFAKTGQDAFGKEVRAGKANVEAMLAKFPVFQIERWIEKLVIDGVRFRGKIDLTGRNPKLVGTEGQGLIVGIVDWKSTSSIQRWGKTPYQLTKDPQMIIYRQSAEEEGCEENLWMAHVYFGTRIRESEIVPTRINRQQLADGLGDIINTLRRMKETAKVLDVSEVAPDRKKCNEGTKFQCPYFAVCPRSQPAVQGASLAMNLFDRFKKTSAAPVAPPDHSPPTPAPQAPAPVPQPVAAAPASLFKKNLTIDDSQNPSGNTVAAPAPAAPVDSPEVAALKAQLAAALAPKAPPPNPPGKEQGGAAREISTAGVLPPDAPASNPALAADPVPGFDPIPKPLKETAPVAAAPQAAAPVEAAPTKSKGGRPPGAKNKAAAVVPTVVVAETLQVAEGKDFEVIEVSLSHGATVKADADPKSYEFIRVDVSMKAAVRRGADLGAARGKLGDLCQEALVAELSRLRPE